MISGMHMHIAVFFCIYGILQVSKENLLTEMQTQFNFMSCTLYSACACGTCPCIVVKQSVCWLNM